MIFVGRFFGTLLSGLCMVLLTPRCHGVQAEEGGLAVEAKIKALDRNSIEQPKGGDREWQVVAVRARFTNRGVKPLPAGEILWGILVAGPRGRQFIEWHQGRSELPELKAAESKELFLGQVHVADGPKGAPPQIEFQLVARHGGANTLRAESIAGFDVLAQTAHRKYDDSGQKQKKRKKGAK